MFKKQIFILLIFNILAVPVFSFEDIAPTSDEALFVRRIMEFWKDDENQIVKSQIREFIQEYPESEFVESLLVILGDTYWSDCEYKEALSAYDCIFSPTLLEKVLSNRYDCLYHLEQYISLIDEITPHLPDLGKVPDDEEQQLWLFYYAEALMKQGQKENNPDLYVAAKERYVDLLNSPYDSNAKFALAEIYQLQGEHQVAADLYFNLAELSPNHCEEMLFKAGCAQMICQPKDALVTFSKIQHMEGKRASEAVLSKIVLLNDIGNYSQLIEENDELRAFLSDDQETLLDYYLGRCYFSSQQYDKAMETLKPLLEKTIGKEHYQATLLTFIASAHQNNDRSEMEKYSRQFEESFPNSPELSRVWYIQALSNKDCDQFPEALCCLEKICSKYPDCENIEAVIFEKALLLYKQGFWEESRNSFLSFIEEYPNSVRFNTALQYIPNATMALIDECEKYGEPVENLQQQMLEDLQLVLDTPGGINKQQESKYLLRMAKTQYDLEQYHAAVAVLDDFIEKFPDDPLLYQAHLLIAMSYQNGLEDIKNFVKHSEMVLALCPNISEKEKLHLNLYSGYLKLAQNCDPIDQQPLFHYAAEHLHSLIATGYPVKNNNLLWLANYYYSKVKGDQNDYFLDPITEKNPLAERSIDLFLKALNINEENLSMTLSQENLSLEQEFFKLSNLYGLTNEFSKQTAILEDLVQQQKEHPNWDWSLRSRTIYALAQTKERAGDEKKALELYTDLVNSVRSTDTFVTSAAKLQYSRLKFDSISVQHRTLNNPDVMEILKTLKDLQIRKTLVQEPIHLEAALDYARIRSSIGNDDVDEKHMLFLLKRVKEDFTAKEDIWSRDYDAARKLHPDKDQIYQAYLMLMDAHIARLEANIAKAKGITHEMEMKNEAAINIYEKLTEGAYAVSEYIVEEANFGLTRISHKSSSEIGKDVKPDSLTNNQEIVSNAG